MAEEALAQLIAGLRESGLDFAGPPLEARARFASLLATIPVASDIRFTPETLNRVPALRARIEGVTGSGALVYLHGGAFVAGSAEGYRGLAAELGRAARLTAHVVDYRLAPEHPFPAAIDDAVVAYRALLDQGVPPGGIAIAGDSAGGGLTVSTLLRLRGLGMPMPGAALLISPWGDLACEGGSMKRKAAVDPSLQEAGLRAAAGHYLGAVDPRDPLASPVHANLAGLPPLMIQVGSAEILIDDAVRLARAAGLADVRVRLEVWPEMIHVWHAFGFMMEAGRAAIAAAGAFLAEHLQPNR